MPTIGLSTLFPAVPLKVGGERLHLRPVVLAEFPEVERCLDGWRLLVATGGEVLDEDAWEDFLGLLCSSVGKPRIWIDQLETDDFERLVATALALNEEIWKPQPETPASANLQWPEILQRLVSEGHSIEGIRNYTLPQARAFLAECFRAEREDLARGIQAAAFSMAESKSVIAVLEKLRRV